MIKILVIGAKLQGIEAIYLAKKAGYFVTVIDHNPQAPGVGLADHYVEADIFDSDRILPCFLKTDFIIPVIEDPAVLDRIRDYSGKTGARVIFDWNAYEISVSKQRSNELFDSCGLALPQPYPQCGYPVILKPDGSSGSSQVCKAESRQELEQYLQHHKGEDIVIQEFLKGPSYSLEVLGDGEHFFFPQITEVVTDESYDCRRITAPAQLTPSEEEQMREIGQKLAAALKIKGIFDIEVINHNGVLKLLEIDARLPSQTPISVYHSTGMNMVEMLVRLAAGAAAEIVTNKTRRVCIYQQVQVSEGKVRTVGEHVMGSSRNLRVIRDFFGAQEAITDYTAGSHVWKAIIVVTGKDVEEAEQKFMTFIQKVKDDEISRNRY